MSKPRFTVYRDGKVHVLSEECATCVFRPHERPVPGARVAELVRDAKDEDGATVVCHKTIIEDPEHEAICRGFYDRLADRDSVLQMAKRMGAIQFQTPPASQTLVTTPSGQ